MKKWHVSALLALLIALLLPLCAHAAGIATEVKVGGVTLDADYPYLDESLTRSDVQPAGGYAYFDATTGTLELHNFELTSAEPESETEEEVSDQ